MSYTTIDAAPGDGIDIELEIKRSRFLTRLRRVASENDARDVIAEQRKTHFDATHNCTAFILGADGTIARSSDDGEPAGTAGVPMLTTLRNNDLTDVVAVVTRYFGGIKLGAGGLVRAYSDAVAAAVAAVGTRTVHSVSIMAIPMPLKDAGAMEAALRGATLASGTPLDVLGTTWGEQAVVEVAVPEVEVDELHTLLAALFGGRLMATAVRSEWRDQI